MPVLSPPRAPGRGRRRRRGRSRRRCRSRRRPAARSGPTARTVGQRATARHRSPGPTTIAFARVPMPSRSRSGHQPSSTTKLISTDEVPIPSPNVRERPCCTTSQGGRPSSRSWSRTGPGPASAGRRGVHDSAPRAGADRWRSPPTAACSPPATTKARASSGRPRAGSPSASRSRAMTGSASCRWSSRATARRSRPRARTRALALWDVKTQNPVGPPLSVEADAYVAAVRVETPAPRRNDRSADPRLASLVAPNYLPYLRHTTVRGRRLRARPSPWRFPPTAPIQHTAGEFPAAERGVEREPG